MSDDRLIEALDWVLDNWVDVHHRLAAGEAVDLGGGRRIAIIEQVGSRPTEHVVTLYEDSWFIEHPIGCTDQPCPYTEAAMCWDEPPLPHGRYEMEMNGDLINVMSDNEDLFRIVTPDPGEAQ